MAFSTVEALLTAQFVFFCIFNSFKYAFFYLLMMKNDSWNQELSRNICVDGFKNLSLGHKISSVVIFIYHGLAINVAHYY